MLLSMTGHGQASAQNDQVRVVAEIKSVNNRFLKTNVHSDLDTELQSKLEALVKQKIKRGSVSLRVKTELLNSSDCLLYTSPSPRDRTRSRMPSSA